MRNSNRKQAVQLAQELNISPLVASMLVNRGIDTPSSARFFLFGKEDFHDPYLLKGMNVAVERIRLAIEQNEPILIFGDYDADGVSSTSLLLMTLRHLGANVDYYIPNRFSEGYGPNEPAFRHAAERGVKLIITVDTGIAAIHEANIAKELGVDLIITDHHEPGPVLPEALAIIHPKLPDSDYPFRELAGVGVAFKVAHALYDSVPEHLLEIAVIGTIADLVSLTGENRLIAKKGLEKLKLTQNPGLKAIFKLAGIEPQSVTEETVGFTLAPRINAVGRLGDADLAVDLLLTEDNFEAQQLAEEIEELNKTRQQIVQNIAQEAFLEVESHFPIDNHKVIVVGKEGWNAGVIGIVASKLVEKYYRPAIVLSYDKEKGLAKGSARSIPGFDLFQHLSSVREFLPHFGGHPMAAGMTLRIDDVPKLRQKLNDIADAILTEDDFTPITYLDEEVRLEDIQLSSLDEIRMLAPFGVDNPKPKVLINQVDIVNLRKIGSEQTHLKLTVMDQDAQLDGVGFGLGSLADEISPAAKISLIGELSINEWNNIRKPQIFVQDIAIRSWQMFDFRGQKHLKNIPATVPEENRKIIVFNPLLAEKITQHLGVEPSIIHDMETAKLLDVCAANIALVDFPPSKELLIQLLKDKHPARIYAYFYKPASDFFSILPTREHFKWFYALLLKKGPIDIKRYGDEIAKLRGWTRETINFMSKVFYELDFVTINNGLISLNKQAQKRDLTDSITFQQKQAQSNLEKELLFSSYQELKKWFSAIIEEAVEFEEALK